MATILLQAAGAALGSVFGPIGAMAGRALGAVAGSVIDQSLFGSSGQGPAHLSNARLPGPDEGTAIPRLYGTARIGGTLIWATRFLETATSEREGGKGGQRVDKYAYSVSLALGLCEGPIAGVRRVWADGRELSLSDLEFRVHTGTRTQLPDPLIEAKQGQGMAPAFRGLAYVVFENLPLQDFGNRIPVLQFEVIRPVGTLESQIRAITVIPGATEHGYDPNEVTETLGGGAARRLNRHTLSGKTDWEASIDELQALCPNLTTVALVASWFGSDLRAGSCRIEPGVEVSARAGESRAWSVSGISRARAHLVSQSGGGPAYGGTPNDAAVVDAIRDLKARGLKVFLYPFLMMDVAAKNGLPDPYGGAQQTAYPWRGRITCHPAPGRPGSPDGTAAIDATVAAFFGNAIPLNFKVDGTTVTYSGSDVGYQRMILHYALLAQAAGGVDGFIIGSELRGVTTLRSGPGKFPAVTRLKQLADTVRAILGSGPAITYGADWSEYFGYQPQDGSGEVWFHLDELWASSSISAVGIDNYLPLADFRDSDLSNQQADGFRHQQDPDGLFSQVAAGERCDWYYASDADRQAGLRSPITDGMAGKRWVYAPKDIAGWWSNRHYNRSGGAEAAQPTAWVPGMKPVFFTELGCPAIDRGANQPNVFLDPKSAESLAPYFSRGYRADAVQRRFLDAHYRHWSSAKPPAGMLSQDRIFVWCWDARPYPLFPYSTDVWSDGGNWQTGHWLNGRLGAGTLADILAAIMTDHGFMDFDVSGVAGDLIGYVKGDVGSARGLIEPLMAAFQLDVIENGDRLRFVSRTEASLPPTVLDVLAEADGEPAFRESRAADAELPVSAVIGFSDPARDHEQSTARARRKAPAGEPVHQITLPAVLDQPQALRMADSVLRDLVLGGRRLSFRLSPNALSLTTGDVVRLPDGPQGRFLITQIEDGADRAIEARAFAAAVAAPMSNAGAAKRPNRPTGSAFAPDVVFADLPRFRAGESGSFACVAALANPWRPMAVLSSPGTDGYSYRLTLDRPAKLGRLAAALAPGLIEGRFDGTRGMLVDLDFGSLSTATRLAVLGGANRLAVQSASGAWEVLGFVSAKEIQPGRFQLTTLLSGLFGTSDAARAGAPLGARVMVLDDAVRSLGLAPQEIGLSRNYVLDAAGADGGRAGPFPFSGGVRASVPLSPTGLRASWTDKLVRIHWNRRGAIDADRWEPADIPQDQDTERYRLEIYNAAGKVARTVLLDTTVYEYQNADMALDIADNPKAITLRVTQLGREQPNGISWSQTIRV